jgi:uncharacterized protein YecT (DUF1311 family)
LCFALSSVHAQTQAAINARAHADFARADADLNKTYQAVLAKLADSERKQKLKEKQRAWVASRDAEVARATNEAGSGSMAPALRYETLTHLTRERIKELEPMLDDGTASGPNSAASESESKQARSVSEGPGPAAAPSANSFSPDKQWEYKGGGIVKADATQVVLDLNQELEVYGPETEILWAPDSKRFGFNYSPLHAHHSVWITVAFYELREEQWVALPSLLKESERSQVIQLAKAQLPKKLQGRREGARRDILKIRRWIDRDTAILYAYSVWDDAAKAAFLFTVKFDAGGRPKIVKTERLPEKEAEEEQ